MVQGRVISLFDPHPCQRPLRENQGQISLDLIAVSMRRHHLVGPDWFSPQPSYLQYQTISPTMGLSPEISLEDPTNVQRRRRNG